MIDEKLFSELVDLYAQNVKAFQEQNSGLIIDTVYPLEISNVEEIINTKEFVDIHYIKTHYKGFTINPLVTDLDTRNGIHRVSISPDISWEKQYHD